MKVRTSGCKQLLFDTNRDGNWEIYSLMISTGEFSNLTDDPNSDDMGGVWSPGGNRVVYEPRKEGRHQLLLMNPDGTEKVLLADGTPGHFRWSEDGTMIAFDAYADTLCDTYVARSDGSGIRNLSRNVTAGCLHFYWSPDGSRIAYGTNRDGNGEVYVSDADGRHQVNVTNHPADEDVVVWRRNR